ncbi:hypothetical protein [Hymenobacter sp.]|jgi:hypothetical protein|uniref:hypothetical protein n=1 Tax=Hymenobacter sp. TaxID=1898978 RepID=UPI002EDA502D
MTKPHLSEYDLQLAAESAPLPAAEAYHLLDCRLCQARLANYQHLFAATARLPKPAFDFNLAATVLTQLPKTKPAFPWVLGIVAFLILGVVSAFVALLGGMLLQAFQSLSTGLGAGLMAVGGFVVAGLCLELLAQHRRQMRQLTFS